MHLALETLVLVMDGSVVGRGCVALMLHVIYTGRALPSGVARAARPEGGISPRRCTYALVQTAASRASPEGDSGSVSGRRRVRWDDAAGDAQRGGLVLCVPHGPEHGG